MDFNDAKTVYVQLDSNEKSLEEHTDVLHALLMFHTVAKLKVVYKTLYHTIPHSTVKGDLVVQLTQMIMKKQDILCQD